jgi:hypothetical protein
MLGLASKIKVAGPPRVRLGRCVRPRWSHACHAGGTAKTHAEWAVVSGVSPVSRNLKLIDRLRQWKRHRGAIVLDAVG